MDDNVLNLLPRTGFVRVLRCLLSAPSSISVALDAGYDAAEGYESLLIGRISPSSRWDDDEVVVSLSDVYPSRPDGEVSVGDLLVFWEGEPSGVLGIAMESCTVVMVTATVIIRSRSVRRVYWEDHGDTSDDLLRSTSPPVPEIHYRDVLVALLQDPHHGATADSILDELHQHGWRVVPR